MGFIGKLVNKAVMIAAGEAVLGEIDEFQRKTRSVDAFMTKNAANYMLRIEQRSFFKHRYVVSNELDEEKYLMEVTSARWGNPTSRLYDMEENEIGGIIRSTRAIDTEYEMYLGREMLGVITEKASPRMKMELDLNGWHLNGNLLQNKFVVTDRAGDIVIRINRAYENNDVYILEMNNHQNEIMGLLWTMAIQMVLNSED